MISTSPKRHSFQKNHYLERMAKDGKTPDNDLDVRAMAEMFDSWLVSEIEQMSDPAWRENNLEYDLRSVDWILDKARSSNSYAQNVYAALCNNSFIKLDVVKILTEQTWSCSWRRAGGIVADMRQEGDYIDWYCSGIKNTVSSQEEIESWSDQQRKEWFDNYSKYVPEGCITDEIRADFKKLGWAVVAGGDWEKFL